MLRTAALCATALALSVCACSSDDDRRASTSRIGPTSTTAPAPDTSASSADPDRVEPPMEGSPVDAAALHDAACNGTLRVRTAGTLPAHLTSVSGLAGSRRHPGVLWAIEDSFEPAAVSALDQQGGLLATVEVEGGPFTNLDWEDLAAAPAADGTPWLYVADIGDNLGIRPEVRVYGFPEPDLEDGSVEPEVITLRRGSGPGNAEALLVDRGDIWVIDKEPDGPAPILVAVDGVLREVGTLDLGGEQVTAVDLAPGAIAVRTPQQVRLYPKGEGDSVRDALAREPCTTPAPPEQQGESVAFLTDVAGLATVSEDEGGDPVELHVIEPAPAGEPGDGERRG